MALVGTFVTPASVREQKERLNPQVHALDGTITNACTAMAPATRSLWTAFVAAWDAFYKADDGFFTAGAEYDFALAQEVELNGWRQVVARQCAVEVGPGNVTPGTVPTTPPADPSTKWLIGGGIALGILLILKR